MPKTEQEIDKILDELLDDCADSIICRDSDGDYLKSDKYGGYRPAYYSRNKIMSILTTSNRELLENLIANDYISPLALPVIQAMLRDMEAELKRLRGEDDE